MPEAIIVSAARTAIGTAFKGTLTETTPEQLTGTVLVQNVNRSGLDPQLIDDVRCRVVGHTVSPPRDVHIGPHQHAAVFADLACPQSS
jgi:acetyl-CoA acetyltransferase